MKNFLSLLLFSLLLTTSTQAQLVISSVFDGPLPGGIPKGIEVYATEDIPDLSIFAFASVNNGSGVDTIEFVFPAVSASSGDYIYLASESASFNDWFGFAPDYTSSAANINGDDAVLLFKNGAVHDVFGDINVDGTDEAWEYLDGWASRVPGTGPDGSMFVLGNWTFSGINALDGETTNATAANPVPIGTYGGGLVADVSVEVSSNKFTPADITINVGETVEWTNVGGFHNVDGTTATYPMNPESFGNGNASSSLWTYSYTFNTPGVYDYECTPHASFDMVGTVTVNGPAAPAYPPYDIADVTTVDADGVPDSINVKCELTGVVHGGDFNGGGSLSFTFIDATGGINCFTSNDFGYTVAEGDMVTVQGAISAFNGVTQISPDTLWMVSAGNALVDPIIVTTALSEATESELVRINNLTIVDPSDWSNSGPGFNVDVTDGTNTYTMRIDNDVDLYGTAAPTGNFDAMGIGSQFDNSAPHDAGYQFFPRYLVDIMPIAPAVIQANEDLVETEVNTPVTIDVLLNDGLPNGLDTIFIVDQPTIGTVGINMDNTITYAPDVDECGEDSFTYTICDAANCDTTTVEVTVNCPVSYPAFTIAEASQIDQDGFPVNNGTTMEVSGIVYGVNLRPSGLQFTIIDPNDSDAGIGLFNFEGNFGYTVAEGDEVVVQGAVGFFNGLTQMNPDSVWLVSSGNALHDPEVVTALGETTESKLVKLENLSLVDPSQWSNSGSGFNVDVTDGTNTYAMRIDNDVDIYGTDAPTVPFNLTGIGGQFDNESPYDAGYQILPRYLGDIDLINSTTDPTLAKNIQVYPNPVNDLLQIQMDVLVKSIELTNLLGQRMMFETSPESYEQLDMSNVPAGIYLLTFYTENGLWTTEVVRQ